MLTTLRESTKGRMGTASPEQAVVSASRSGIIHDFALKSPFFMLLGAFRLNRAVFVLAVVSSLSFVSCGGYSRPYKKPPSGLTNRVLVSQDVSSSFTLAGLVIIDAQKDLRARASEINAGNTPGLMALSPTKATLLAFDSSNKIGR